MNVRTNIRIKIGASMSVAALAMLAMAGSSFAEDLNFAGEAREHCAQMLESGKDAINHGEMKHTDVAMKHIEEMKNHAEQCYARTEKAIYNAGGNTGKQMHGKEGLKHLQPTLDKLNDALNHGRMNHHDEMMKYAKEAMKHAVEGNSHVKEMK